MKLNTFHLKLLATVFMVIDHVAFFLVPEHSTLYLPMRIIGRLAAPLFWYSFSVGFRYTASRKRYVARLGFAAGGMMLGNMLVQELTGYRFENVVFQPNIFLTMFLVALCIAAIDGMKVSKKGSSAAGCMSAALVLALFTGFFAEYGWIAVISILCLYYGTSDLVQYAIFTLLSVLLCLLEENVIQVFMIMAVPFMLLCRNERPAGRSKYFFYIFYPLHIWVLAIISMSC